MKNLVILFASTFLTHNAPAFASDLSGEFQCDDGGTLSLRNHDIGAYYASLTYPDHSSSTLAEIIYSGESLRGKMLRDDEDAFMGHVISADFGNRLVLHFSDCEKVTCTVIHAEP